MVASQPTLQGLITENPPNWKNRTLFRGDNLRFLRGMDSGSVEGCLC